MLSPWIYLLMNGLFFTLRLSGGSGSFPRPLKAAEEREYLERAAQGDLEARNILVEHNLRLVAHIVKKYYAQTGDQDDLISIGTIGLIKGISTFKADRNVRLATYASRCIENEILMYFRAQRKLQSEVSLADTLESAGEGGSLSLMDVIAVDDNMLEELDTRDACAKVRGTAGCKKKLLETIRGDAERLSTKWDIDIAVAGSYQDAAALEDWREMAVNAFPEHGGIFADPLSFSVSSHVGPDAFGMAVSRRLARTKDGI